jgi:NAD-dependent dihydropyrimidine dehydrogenase PreA subunit
MDVFTWDEELNMPKVTYASDCWFEGTCMMECPKRAIDISLPLSSW